MADAWSVPIATGLFTDLNDTIAKGIPAYDLGKAFEGFQSGYKFGQDWQANRAFREGLPRDAEGNIDWGAARDTIARLGGANQLQNIIGLENLRQQQNLPPITLPQPPRPDPAPVSTARPPGQAAYQDTDNPLVTAATPAATPSPPNQNLTSGQITRIDTDGSPTTGVPGGITPRMAAKGDAATAERIAARLGIGVDQTADRGDIIAAARGTDTSPTQATALSAPTTTAPSVQEFTQDPTGGLKTDRLALASPATAGVTPRPVQTETIRPPAAQAAPEQAPAQVAQAAPPASQIQGISPQAQGQFNAQAADYYEQRAAAYEEAARRAAAARNPELAQSYSRASQDAAGYAKMYREGLIKTQTKAGEIQLEQEKGIFDASRQGFLASKDQQFQLDTIDQDLKTMGPDWVGAGANARAKLARTGNTLLGLLPDAVRSSLPREIRDGFSNEALASWESFNKASQKLGFALAKQLGSREAMQIVQAATASVPNAEQTYWGARLVSAGMRQAAQREADFHQYVIGLKRNGQSILDADINFNKQHPVQEYVKKAASVVPSQDAINYMRANDSKANRAYFNQTYGDGATVGVFGPDR